MKKRKTRAGNLQAFQDASLKLEPLKKISIENSMGVQIRNTKAQLTRVENRLDTLRTTPKSLMVACSLLSIKPISENDASF